MSKQKKLIPQLRFPEFEKDGEWEETTLGTCGTFIRGLTYNSNDTSKSGLLVLRASNIQNERLVLDKDLVFVDKNCSPELLLKKGDIVICMSNGSKPLVGKNAEYVGDYEGEITIGAFCSLFRPENNFSKFLLQTYKYKDFISYSIGGGNINNLKNSDLEGFLILIPPNPKEQQRIASCLSSLDDLITAQAQKLEVLKKHKKGLLQKLFPAQGETMPALRFPEFEKDGEWEETTLGTCGTFIRGLTYNSNDTSKSGLLVLRASNIQNERLVLDKDLVFVDKNCSPELLLKKGDIVICMSNGSKPLVGKNAEYVGDYEGEITIGAFCSLFRPENNFSKFLLQTYKYKDFISYSIGGGNINNLKNSDLEGFLILIPPNPKEQQRIASCLSSLDDLITAQAQKLEVLKKHKKGLLQGLFPTVDEGAQT